MPHRQMGWRFHIFRRLCSVLFCTASRCTDLMRRSIKPARPARTRSRSGACSVGALDRRVGGLCKAFLVCAVGPGVQGRESFSLAGALVRDHGVDQASRRELNLAAVLRGADDPAPAIAKRKSCCNWRCARPSCGALEAQGQSALPVQLPQFHPRTGGGKSGSWRRI